MSLSASRNESIYPLSGKRIWVAGHRGMVGAALLRRLEQNDCMVLTVDRDALDLTRQEEVESWLGKARPQAIFFAAAKVGGIFANLSSPVDFLYDNLIMGINVIHAAAATHVEKLLYLGSSCVYPKLAPQPISETALLDGPLESTNEWYAIAKIGCLKFCQAYRRQYKFDFISAMPTNLYGPGDNFDLNTSHVIPALIRKAHEAKLKGESEMVIWGSGTPRREFLHVDDAADVLVRLMTNYSADEPVNVGSGSDLSILELAHLIADVVGFSGKIVTDSTKPDGAPCKLLDVTKLSTLGWVPRIDLRAGLEHTYRWFLNAMASNEQRVRLSRVSD